MNLKQDDGQVGAGTTHAKTEAVSSAGATTGRVSCLAPSMSNTPARSSDSTGAASVDRAYHWIPVSAATPRGTKLQLINQADGVAQYGQYTPGSAWTHYALLPTFAGSDSKTMRDALIERIDELTAKNSYLRKRWDAAQAKADCYEWLTVDSARRRRIWNNVLTEEDTAGQHFLDGAIKACIQREAASQSNQT